MLRMATRISPTVWSVSKKSLESPSRPRPSIIASVVSSIVSIASVAVSAAVSGSVSSSWLKKEGPIAPLRSCGSWCCKGPVLVHQLPIEAFNQGWKLHTTSAAAARMSTPLRGRNFNRTLFVFFFSFLPSEDAIGILLTIRRHRLAMRERLLFGTSGSRSADAIVRSVVVGIVELETSWEEHTGK